MESSALKKEEESTFYQEDRNQPIPPPNVVAYNELRSCADLNRMFISGKLEIQPDFQRDVVWKKDEQARFVDSLIKQLPIPSMCFSLDAKTQKWKVIDGLQRMHTITTFLGSADWRIEDVEDIDPRLKNVTNNALRNGNDDQRQIFSSVEDLSIPVTVIRCSYDEASHMKYLFTIFNRLNSGGVRLNNQEIRNCIYSGQFNNLLKDFDAKNSGWAHVKRQIWGRMDRFRSVEVLLRVLAFSKELEAYDGNLAGFLNSYMHSASRSTEPELSQIKESLEFLGLTAEMALSGLGTGKRSLTLMEGLLVGLLANQQHITKVEEDEQGAWLKARVKEFVELEVYVSGPRYALSSAATVKDRLGKSIAVFAS